MCHILAEGITEVLDIVAPMIKVRNSQNEGKYIRQVKLDFMEERGRKLRELRRTWDPEVK